MSSGAILRSPEIGRKRRFAMASSCALLAAHLLQPALAGAEELPLCIGFNPETKRWGPDYVPAWQTTGFACPAGYAMMQHDLALGRARLPQHIPPIGNCCPLPTGALTDSHVFAPGECPKDHVATGGRLTRPDWNQPEFELRCTRINTSDYKLEPPQQALLVEMSEDLLSFTRRTMLFEDLPRTGWGLVPPRLRYGLSRLRRTETLIGGCIGYPWGSVLVRLGRRYCRGSLFAKVTPRHRAEPPDTCRAVQNIYSPEAECIR